MESAKPTPRPAALDADDDSKGQASERVVVEAAAALRGPAASAPFGLLTDSVLEVKWLAQERTEAARRAKVPRPPPPGMQLPESRVDVAQSNPYAAYAAFLRIAAPTAALGADVDDDAPTAGVGEQVQVDENASMVEIARARSRAAASATPYSAGVLARRMLRYHLGRRNRDEFLSFFVGEFDNYDQVCVERKEGMEPGASGGHEHIHCSLSRTGDDGIVAKYYFNGNPSVVFRSRLYRVAVCECSDRGLLEMSIYRPTGKEDEVEALPGCEVFWERYEPGADDEDKGAQALGIERGATRFVGYMTGGGCNLYSREINTRICVMDDLLLTAQDLWVADRAFDGDGNFVYGNRRGIPYKMKRVDPDGPLAWTLSDTPPPDGYVP